IRTRLVSPSISLDSIGKQFGPSLALPTNLEHEDEHEHKHEHEKILRIYLSLDALDVDAIPALCARTTSSATDVAPIFSITRPRWTLIVPSVVPNCAAICLLSMPATTPLSTSNSRGVSVPSRSRTSLRCKRWSHSSEDRLRARSTQL